MTTKEIAQAVGKTERSVQGWAKKTGEKISSVGEKISSAGHGKAADFDLDETLAIIETGMGKNAADIYRMNAKEGHSEKPQSPEISHLGAMVANLAVMMDATMKMMVTQQNQISAMLAGNHSTPERKTLPAPQLDARSHIIKLANEYVSKTGIEHRDAYTMLYREFGYRTHCNAILSAKNRGMKIIDYIDSEGQIETLEAIALEAFAS